MLKNALVLLGALVALLSVAFFTVKKQSPKDNVIFPSPQSVDFLKKQSTLPEILAHFKDHTILFSVKDEASLKLPKQMRKRLAAIGGRQFLQLGLRHSYAAIFKDGKIVKEAISPNRPVSLKTGSIKVESAGNKAGNFSRLTLNAVQYTAENRGLNLFVVNPSGKLVGVWNFDFFVSENPRSSAMEWNIGNLSTLEITLSEKQYRKLKTKRDQAIKDQVLLSSSDDLVPARLRFHNEDFKAQLRLKGDWVDHLQGDQWSFRVKIKDNRTLMGMRKFSLHRPATRNYAGEWLFHQVLADAGLMHLQYHFIKVILRVQNGPSSEVKDLGIYALEEGFDKLLIERNRRREGVILKLDESLMWEEHQAYLKGRLDIPDLQFLNFHHYQQMPVVPFEEGRILADTTLYKQYLTGSALFRDFIDGKKKLSEVFDVERTARFTAIANLLGANHALGGHNYRVYYNPVTSKLEPIGFDGNAGKKVYGFAEFFNSRNDLAYQEAYVKAVEEVTSDQYIQRLINWPGLTPMVELMQTVYHKYEWTADMLIHNQRRLQASIHPKHPLRINFNGIENGYFNLSIENFSRRPIEVLDLTYKGKKVFGKPESRTILPAKSRTTVPLLLDKDYRQVFTKKGKHKVGFNPVADMDKVLMTYRTPGSQFVQKEKVFLWPSDRKGLALKDPFQRPANARDFDFLVFDEDAKTITCLPGDWDLDNNLVVPPGYTFVAGPGCRIRIRSQYTAIFSYSPLRFIGTPAHPVQIYSDTDQGLGLLVLNTSDTSVLRYCRFTNLSRPGSLGWSVTGAVNFYEADVVLQHCSFEKNRCEDALNILRSHFDMSHCTFTDIHADAFDGDFVTGSINNCLFANIGNDAIDVSGSKISVENTAIENAGDKGISAGEKSHITASHILIKNSEIAIACKDQSFFKINTARLQNNKLAFTAFQKKPEYGPASITADSIELIDNYQVHLIETRSSLLLNGQKTETTENVKSKMYGVEFGKKSG